MVIKYSKEYKFLCRNLLHVLKNENLYDSNKRVIKSFENEVLKYKELNFWRWKMFEYAKICIKKLTLT